MNNYILRCEKCGKMFKAHTLQQINGQNVYITDYNDKLQDHSNCVICKQNTTYKVLKTQSWIADLVFTIKGK